MAQRFPKVQKDGTWTDDPEQPPPQDRRLIELRPATGGQPEETDTANE